MSANYMNSVSKGNFLYNNFRLIYNLEQMSTILNLPLTITGPNVKPTHQDSHAIFPERPLKVLPVLWNLFGVPCLPTSAC